MRTGILHSAPCCVAEFITQHGTGGNGQQTRVSLGRDYQCRTQLSSSCVSDEDVVLRRPMPTMIFWRGEG
jgi:hypothetical protein